MKNKNIWLCILFILAGLVIGGLIGELTSNISFLWWLGYGQEFGISTPLVLDLSAIKITFGLMFKLNIASILGLIIALVIYRKVL